jgi:predicted HTH transcriptional regulator
MIFRGRTISTEADLQWFIESRVQESIDIEYKSESYGGNDESRREFLRDVTFFANAQGGLILIGIGEDGEGIASDMPGIEKNNYSETIVSFCLNNIEQRIMGLNCEEIEISGRCVVIALTIPRSLNALHMVTFKGHNQFWRRNGRQKSPMSVGEIMDVLDNRLRGRSHLDEFAGKRDAEIMN